jgi:hypothetical protein
LQEQQLGRGPVTLQTRGGPCPSNTEKAGEPRAACAGQYASERRRIVLLSATHWGFWRGGRTAAWTLQHGHVPSERGDAEHLQTPTAEKSEMASGASKILFLPVHRWLKSRALDHPRKDLARLTGSCPPASPCQTGREKKENCGCEVGNYQRKPCPAFPQEAKSPVDRAYPRTTHVFSILTLHWRLSSPLNGKVPNDMIRWG